MGLLRIIMGVSVLLLLGCSLPGDTGLRTELRNASAIRGLALAAGISNRVVVIPFDAEERYFKNDYRGPVVVVFGKSGRVVLWQRQPSFMKPSQFLVSSIRGDTLANIEPPASEFIPKAINDDPGRLAFWGTMRGTAGSVALRWASLDFSYSGVIAKDAHYCDWSTNGETLAYEKDDRIFVFDISSGVVKFLMAGRYPTWSADGKSIAYQAQDGRAALVTLQGARVDWALRSHRPTSPIRWSPSGRYVAFTEATPGPHIPLISAYYQLLVCRVSDGKSITVRAFGERADSQGFAWILDYRQFCGSCGPGEPFN